MTVFHETQGVSEHDVVVVGGGPAGLSAALASASRGCRTLVLEREAEIGEPVHTSGASSVDTMRAFGIPPHLYHVVSSLRIAAPRRTASFSFAEPTICILDVRGMYRELARRAEEAGATVLTGAKALGPIVESGSVVGCTVERNGGTHAVRSRVLVDAGGYRASISKKAGLHPGFRRFGVGAEYDLLAPDASQSEVLVVVGSRYAPAGYAWVAPWGHGRLRVGVGVLHADTDADPRSYLDQFYRDLGAFGVELGDAEIREVHYGLIPSGGRARRLAGNGIMAVGDAAGQASLVVGEGIRLAMIAGQMAGRTAAEAIVRGPVLRSDLSPYETSFNRRYGRTLDLGYRLNRKMATWTDDDWDDRVKEAETIPPRVISQLLQSDFRALQLLPWLATSPRQWPRAARYAARALVAR